MANKKTKRRAPRSPLPPRQSPKLPASLEPREAVGGDDAKRKRREAAKRQAQARVRKLQRRRLLKRGAVWVVVAALLGTGAAYLRHQQQGKNRVAAQANQVAQAAGCTPVTGKPDLGNTHLSPGEQHTYAQHPATSGPHVLSPLPGSQHVYDAPVPETRAVHNLEHGYVLIYFGGEGDEALRPETVRRLEAVASAETKVIMAPYGQLSKGTSLALVAWDELQECPSAVTPEQASGLAHAFFTRFRGGGKAPEPSAP